MVGISGPSTRISHYNSHFYPRLLDSAKKIGYYNEVRSEAGCRLIFVSSAARVMCLGFHNPGFNPARRLGYWKSELFSAQLQNSALFIRYPSNIIYDAIEASSFHILYLQLLLQ
jgi:hypothetical protein